MDRHTLFRRSMLRWHREHGRPFPWRVTDDPYAVLVGEVLLQRTRGEHVVAVYEEALRRWPDADAMARARLSTIGRVIKPLGLSQRATVLKRLGEALAPLETIPMDPEKLCLLPGIGRYGAHAVPIFAAGRDLPLVDWVIARVLRRYFGMPTGRRPNADKELWDLAHELVVQGRARELWLGTLDFAAAVCKPAPACNRCPLNPSCEYSGAAGRDT